MILTSPRLSLTLQTPDEVLAWIETLPEEVRKEFSPVWIERVRTTSIGDPWSLGYRICVLATEESIGTCAFKGPPDADGMVEIAYGIDEPYRGRGFATEAAMAMVEFAKTQEKVKIIRAHTKHDNPASIRVIEKAGFRSVGDVIDPEDGLVMRFEMEVD